MLQLIPKLLRTRIPLLLLSLRAPAPSLSIPFLIQRDGGSVKNPRIFGYKLTEWSLTDGIRYCTEFVLYKNTLFSIEPQVFLESLEIQPQNILRISLLNTSFKPICLVLMRFCVKLEKWASASFLGYSYLSEPRYSYKRYSNKDNSVYLKCIARGKRLIFMK